MDQVLFQHTINFSNFLRLFDGPTPHLVPAPPPQGYFDFISPVPASSFPTPASKLEQEGEGRNVNPPGAKCCAPMGVKLQPLGRQMGPAPHSPVWHGKRDV